MKTPQILDWFEKKLRSSIKKDKPASAPLSTPVSARAFITCALNQRLKRTVLCVTDGPQSLETFHRDTECMHKNIFSGKNLPEEKIFYFPLRDQIGKEKAEDPSIETYRLETLTGLIRSNEKNKPSIVATCIQALRQKTLSPSKLKNNTMELSLSSNTEMDNITAFLQKTGYVFSAEVQEKSQASIKGGLIDFWPPTETAPVRIECFDNRIESIRTFDPVTQRSMEKKNFILATPAGEEFIEQSTLSSSLLEYLPHNTIVVWSNIHNIKLHSDLFTESSCETGTSNYAFTEKKLTEKINSLNLSEITFTDEPPPKTVQLDIDLAPLPSPREGKDEILRHVMNETERTELISNLCERSLSNESVFLFLDTEGSLDHAKNELKKRKNRIQLARGTLSNGFMSNTTGLVIAGQSNLYGRRKPVERRYDPSGISTVSGGRLYEFSDIEPGDLVVHTEHGIGKYLGLHEIVFNGQLQEALSIEYANNAKLHIPLSQIHLLSRYVGLSKSSAKLHSIDTGRWKKEKHSAETAIMDLASSLLEIQAKRNVKHGFISPPDKQWQHEFEASFPYRETTDQERAIKEVKLDMESPKPMDRLVCGDAGYGKTEVAMRSAFKTVMNEKQVAVLVPTTVLAQQHFDTFRERMASYPVRIEMLSRFIPGAKRSDTVKGMADGSIDIVIGTHALLQPNIIFKDLGLVIIDEEQRFGVTHKEKLKQMRHLVDVLTLTATPIPRTLYMSMTGARSMSLIQTPPGERVAVETIITKNTEKTVREAILRELNREGQVFYLYNRVATIDRVKEKLEQIVPEARIVTAHGQMPVSQLSSVMREFVSGRYDVLLCTTIIESGMDIPRANTILIDRADRFGISELYQLRGRVGRSNLRAYAYFLLPSHGAIDGDARRRLGAVKKYSHLSSGFKLALKDLEIRGAGNLLGSQQSGHITAIGFGLYCQLLKRTISMMKGEKLPTVIDTDLKLDFISLSTRDSANTVPAVIPYEYIEDETIRIRIYRKIAELVSIEEVNSLREELRDMFGPIPLPVERLLKMASIRIMASIKGIKLVEVKGNKLLIKKSKGDYLMIKNRMPRLKETSPDNRLDEIISLLTPMSFLQT